MNNKKKWNNVPTDILYDYENDGGVDFKPLKPMISALPKRSPLTFAYGTNKNSKVVIGNFNKLSHMLIVGDYGYGKEMFLDTFLITLIMRNSPDNLKIALINTKRAVPENLKKYSKLPHLYCHITNTIAKRDEAFRLLCEEMNDRYSLFRKYGVSNITEYNKSSKTNKVSKLPIIIAVINDYKSYVHTNITNSYALLLMLAQKGRACGIHMVICTPKRGIYFVGPSLRANTPTSIMFDQEDGDSDNKPYGYKMFVKSIDIKNVRPINLKCGFISQQEINNVIDYVINNN